MTRRERKEARMQRRLDWAAGREQKATQAFDGARKIADGIPFGQPILVGHHSERHARRDADRIDSGMRRGVESQKMAEQHRAKADGIAHQLETSIFSDDPDAPERLGERIAALEAKRAKMKAANAAYRKGDPAFAEAMGVSLEAAAALRVKIEAGYSWCRQPYPRYEMTNLGANIRRLAERLRTIEAGKARTETAKAQGGVLVEGADWVRVTFAEKPSRATLDALKAAGFRWGAGHWVGQRVNLPAEVLEGGTGA